MAIGPVQLLAIGFYSPDFEGEALDELARLEGEQRRPGLDALVVYKDADGDMAVAKVAI